METDDTAVRLPLFSNQRPGWQRLLIWGGIILIGLQALPALIYFGISNQASPLGAVLLALILSLPFGGLNVLRTCRSKPTFFDKVRHDSYAAHLRWLNNVATGPGRCRQFKIAYLTAARRYATLNRRRCDDADRPSRTRADRPLRDNQYIRPRPARRCTAYHS